MKVLPLKGPKSLRALNVFHTLMLGLKMLPAYAGEYYEEFYARLDAMPPSDQEKMIREAVLFVELNQEDLESVCQFATDNNGVPYSKASLHALPMKDIVEIVVQVCKAVAEIKIDFVSESEKKN